MSDSRLTVKLWIFQVHLLTDFSSNLAFRGIVGAFGPSGPFHNFTFFSLPFVQGPPAPLFRVAKGAELH